MSSSIVLFLYSSLLPQSSPRQWRRPSRTYSLNSHPVAILYVSLATLVSLFLLCVLSALCVLCVKSLSFSLCSGRSSDRCIRLFPRKLGGSIVLRLLSPALLLYFLYLMYFLPPRSSISPLLAPLPDETFQAPRHTPAAPIDLSYFSPPQTLRPETS